MDENECINDYELLKTMGLKSLGERLSALEENTSQHLKIPIHRLSALIRRSEDVKLKTLENELEKLSSHFAEKIRGINNIFEVISQTVTYTEMNCVKLSLLLSVPVTGEFKLQCCISLLSDLDDVQLDEQLVIELVTFLCPLLFPKPVKNEETEPEAFEEPSQLKRSNSVHFKKKRVTWGFNTKRSGENK